MTKGPKAACTLSYDHLTFQVTNIQANCQVLKMTHPSRLTCDLRDQRPLSLVLNILGSCRRFWETRAEANPVTSQLGMLVQPH